MYFILPPKLLQFCFYHHPVRLANMTLITHYQGLLYIGIINHIELVSSSARVKSAKFQKGLVCTYGVERPGPIDRTMLHQLVQLAYMSFSTNSQGLFYIGIMNSIELVSSVRVTSAKSQPKLLYGGRE